MKAVKPKTFLKKPTPISKTKEVPKEIIKETTNEKICGVYMIHNTFHNRKYIGSSKDVDRRIKTHKKDLEKGSHDSRFMQRDYDEVGEEFFKFTILEDNIDEELLTAYEKYYIYKHDAIVMYKGYNDIMPTTNHKLFKQIYELKEGA